MLNVGLTGGIACGKSTVSRIFVRLGAHLIDFDKLAHEVQEPGKRAWQEIVNYFGCDVLGPDKNIDRNKVAAIVFDQQEKLKALNNIVHPLVAQEWQTRLENIKAKDPHAIVLSDIPLLYETKAQRLFDLTVLVVIFPEEQISRLMARNGLTLDEAQKRLQSQMPISEKIKLADIVIDNRGTVEETEQIVRSIWQELLNREAAKRKSQ